MNSAKTIAKPAARNRRWHLSRLLTLAARTAVEQRFHRCGNGNDPAAEGRIGLGNGHVRIAPVGGVWPIAHTAQGVFCRRTGDLTRVHRTRNAMGPAANCRTIADRGKILGPGTPATVDGDGPFRSSFGDGRTVLRHNCSIADGSVSDRGLLALAIGKRAGAQGAHGDTRALPVEPCRPINCHACADAAPGRLKCPKAQTAVARPTHRRPGAQLLVDSARRKRLRRACALSAV